MAEKKVKRIGKLSYSISDPLKSNRGRYGKVFTGMFEEIKAVAVKRLDKSETQVDINSYLTACEHPNIIQYFCLEKGHLEYLFLATQLCAGTLEGLVNGSYTGPTVGDSREVLRQITAGLDHLHSLIIIHGDLKPTNVLISHPTGSVCPLMKLTDCGLRHLKNKLRFQPAHTRGWMCPFDKEDDTAFDLFSLGCLYFFTIFKGQNPFGETKEIRINRIATRQPIIPLTVQQLQTIGIPVWELIKQMLDFNALLRPTTSIILAHSFFSPQQFFSPTPPENFISGQKVTPAASQLLMDMTSASSRPLLPSGEPPHKMTRTEQQPPTNFYSHSTQKLFIFNGNRPRGNDQEHSSIPPLMPITETIHRVSENPQTITIDLRTVHSGVWPFYPPSLPPSILSSCQQAFEFVYPSQQQPSSIDDMSKDTQEPGPTSSAPLLQDESTGQEESITDSVQPIEPSIPNNGDIPLNTEEEELRSTQNNGVPIIPSPLPSQPQRMAQGAKQSTSRQCLRQTHKVTPSVHRLESQSKSDDSDDDEIIFIEELINENIYQQQPIRITDVKSEGATIASTSKDTSSTYDLLQEAVDMWVPWNMPDLSIPRPGSVPLTLETTSTPVTQSYVTLPSDGRPRHMLNNSSSSSSEHPPLVPTGQRDDRQSDSGPAPPSLNDWSYQITPMQKTLAFAKLCDCREFNDYQMMRFQQLALDMEVMINYRDSEGLSPLLNICRHHKSNQLYECIEILLRRPDLNIHARENSRRANALNIVCRCYSGEKLLDIVKLFLRHKIAVDTLNENNENVLMGLCINYKNDNIIDIIHLLLQQPTIIQNLNAVNKDMGWDALVLLCFHYNGNNLFDVARILLMNDIQTDSEFNQSDNALIATCNRYKHKNLIDVVRLLLHHKINVHLTNPTSGGNALIALCKNYTGSNLMDIIKVLLGAGIDVNSKTVDGHNCLFALAEKQTNHRHFQAITKLLIENNIDLNAQLKDGANVFIYLSEVNGGGKLKPGIAELLIRNGINLNARTKTDHNILLSLAKNPNYLESPNEKRDFMEIIKLLIRKGINVQHKNDEGMNVLHLLCKFHRGTDLLDIVQQILTTADIERVADNNGYMPEQYIRHRKLRDKTDIIQLLTKY